MQSVPESNLETKAESKIMYLQVGTHANISQINGTEQFGSHSRLSYRLVHNEG